MTKVVVLSHVKASSVPSTASSTGRRIPWLGGKIVSNKEEALRKFYERKLNAGGALNDRQIDALQKTLGITVDKAQHSAPAHINPKKLHATHRPHGKVQASSNKTIVINGRIVGPKVTADTRSSSSKAPGATRQPHHASSTKFVKAPTKFTKTKAPASSGSSLALEDKLDLPLDALVHNKSTGSQKRLRK